MSRRRSLYKRKIKKIIEHITVKYESLSIAKQVAILGSIIGLVSIFFPWIIESSKAPVHWNALTSMSGNIGYFLLILFIGNIFLLVSEAYKEKVKLYTDIDLKNYFIILFSGIITIILGIVSISFSVGLSFLSQYIQYGQGPILTIVAGILTVIAGIFIRVEDKKNNSEIILQKLSQNRDRKKEKENMELPF